MRINPNSSIRSGYTFEDLQVVKLCFDWIISPKSYKAIRIQYIPDEIDHSKFYLDDIIAIDKKNHYHFYQLKYKQNPQTDFWTFKTLLDKGNKKQSLLEKWTNSFKIFSGKGHQGFFITNGFPDNQLKSCLKAESLDAEKLAKLFPQWFRIFSSFFSNHDELTNFLNSFHFQFGHPEKNEFEKQLREAYYSELKVTKSGFDNLLLTVLNEGGQKYPKDFLLDDIKKLLQWYIPRPLKQNFEVPLDFELYDNDKHKSLLKDLKRRNGGIKVIIGKPGVGKSTYLSNLHDLLNNHLSIQSVRHHYHLNTKDSSYYERLDAARAEEALKAEFRKLPDHLLGNLANQNLHHTPLKDIIANIASHYYQNGKAFVLIIDGLDHVIRERKSEKELQNFLNEVLYPQKGLWIILGTQELTVPHFNSVITRNAPKEKWIEIKGLKKESVAKIVSGNAIMSKIPEQEHLQKEFIDGIVKKTAGNALHLRYLLKQLNVSSSYVSLATLKSIVDYKEEIANYYTDLWNQISPIGKTFLLAITLFDYKINEKDLIDFGSYLTTVPSKITVSFDQIKHLLRNDISGISVYHNSFLVFINNQKELGAQRSLLYQKSRKWLKNSTNKQLKWLLEPQVEYYLGNSKLLMNIDRDWIIESFLLCRNENQIVKLLDLAKEAAFKKKDYAKVLLFGIFAASIENRDLNLHESIHKIWGLSFKLNAKDELAYPDIDTLEAYQIKDYVIALQKHGILQFMPDEVYERFNELFRSKDNLLSDVIPYWIELLVHFPEEKDMERIHKFMAQFRKDHSSGHFYSIYIKLLLETGDMDMVKALINHKFIKEEKYHIAKTLMAYNLESGFVIGKDFIASALTKSEDYAIGLYELITSNEIPELNRLPSGLDFPNTVEYHGSSKSEKILELYLNTFHKGIILYLNDQDHIITSWSVSQDNRWPISVMNALFKISKFISNAISKKAQIDYEDVIAVFEPIRMLDFRDDHEIYEIRRSVIPACITTILKFSLFLNKANNNVFEYSDRDIENLISCKWFYNNTVVNHLLSFSKPPISVQGLSRIIYYASNGFEKNVEPFREKAETLIDLATIAYKCNDVLSAKELLLKAAQNLVSYGYHKDMYLYSILKGIEACGQAGSFKTTTFIRQVAPYVHEVENFTDGDETGSFIHDLADLYGTYKPDWLYKLYQKSINEQDYAKADIYFADIASLLPLPNPVNSAILNTSIDQNSYNTLIYRSKTEPDALKILTEIQSRFGNIDYDSRSQHDNERSYGADERPAKYLKVLPANLAVYLQNLKVDRHQQREYVEQNYLENWVKSWLNVNGVSPREIYFSIRGLIESRFNQIRPETLSLLYPIVLDIDRDKAFEYLLWHHANASVWSSIWSKTMEESKEMWKILIKDFPDRLDEYFDRSIYYSGSYYENGENYFLPIPKSIAYFIACGNLSKAEQIVSIAINHLEELIPGTELPALTYLNDKELISELDILLIRLTWVNPTVRERAAFGISQLLVNDEAGETHKYILKWLFEQKLESIICYALIIFLKSLEKAQSKSYVHLNIDDLQSKIKFKSTTLCILIDLILQHFEIRLPLKNWCIPTERIIYEMPELKKFKRNVGYHTQIIFTELCNRLEFETSFGVFNLWALIFEEKRKEIGLTENWHIDDYCNTKREYIMARITIVGDMLRSSFMNVIDYLYNIGLISREYLFHESFRLIPIDLSIWNINLSEKPEWWPQFVPEQKDSKGDVLSPSLINPIKNLINPIEGWNLFHLNGCIIPDGDFYEGTLNGRISILPFAYKVTGSTTLTAQEIYPIVNNFGVYHSIPDISNNFNFFETQPSFIEHFSFPIFKKNVMIFPLLANVETLSSHTWQLYRMFSTLMLPIPRICAGLAYGVENGELKFIDLDGEEIYQSKDFLFGLKDRVGRDTDIPFGRYLLVKDGFIESILSTQHLQLGYVCKIDYKTRKYRHSDEVEKSTFFELINFSTIIR